MTSSGAPSSGPRRFRVTGPGTSELASFEPRDPGEGELLVAPDAVGICATDLEIADGSMVYFTSGLASYPITLGHEWTGRVVSVGPGVEGFVPGQRVVGEVSIGCRACPDCGEGAYHQCPNRTETGIMGRDGALADLLVFPARAALPVAASVDPRDAALIEPLAVAVHALDLGHLVPDERPLIVGAGPIGLLLGLAAVATGGAPPLLVEPVPDRRAAAEAVGLEAVEPETVTPRAWSRVIEASGRPPGVALAMEAVRRRGRVVLIGLTGTASQPVPLDRVVVEELTIHGSLGSPWVWPRAVALVERGDVHPSSLVTHEFTLDRVEEAFATVASRAPGVLKVLIRPGTTS